jgi:hypothetical protein
MCIVGTASIAACVLSYLIARVAVLKFKYRQESN